MRAFAALAGAAAISFGADRVSDRLVFPGEVSFGKIANNRPAVVVVRVRNPGGDAVRIGKVTTSCGCLRAEISPEEIPARGEASLRLEWDPRGKIGTNEKIVRIDAIRAGHEFVENVRVTGTVEFVGKAGTIFEGSCNACHGAPAAGKSGEELFASVCAVCHGRSREGVPPSPMIPPARFSSFSDRALFDTVYDGAWDKGMPGFGLKAGGPLDSSQVASLARLLRSEPHRVSETALPAAVSARKR